jgi:AraC family transcriptional regulator
VNERQLQKWIDGKKQPVFSHSPLLSSALVPWGGFPAQRERCVAGQAASIVSPHTEVIMVRQGGICIEGRGAGPANQFFAGPGSITIWPAAYEVQAISWKTVDAPGEPTEMISVHLDPSVLRLLTPELEGQPVSMQAAIEDPMLSSLIGLIETDIRSGCSTGRLYGESLSVALASGVLARYAVLAPAQRPVRAGLSIRQRERVRDLIHANLGGDLSFGELARVAGLSAPRFAVVFRNTFGTSPHQYILKERIKEARALLALRHLSIADVALAVGFSSQSHFTLAFKNAVGVTPRHYRASV